MTDLGWLALWTLVLALALGGCVLLHHVGVATTYVRDLLHIGAGVWVLGWPMWRGEWAPLGLVVGAAIGTAAVPAVARHFPRWSRLQHSLAAGDERWSGLVLYTLAFALLTGLGLWLGAFPAAAALLALALGDGIGGAVGRRYGRHAFRAPGGKQKSFEGSLTVWAAATAGILIASLRFGAELSLPHAAGLGLSAAVGEALSPRGTDNLIVPVGVWALAAVST